MNFPSNTPLPNAQTGPLCDHCHQKPRYPGHNFCSKTCGSQASAAAKKQSSSPWSGPGSGSSASSSALCKQCHQRPRFQTHDYCGKHCASLARASGNAGPATQGNNKFPTYGNNPGPPGNPQPPLMPAQIAQLVTQLEHIPQVQALLGSQAAQVQVLSSPYQQKPAGKPPYTNNKPSQNPFDTNIVSETPSTQKKDKNGAPNLGPSSKYYPPAHPVHSGVQPSGAGSVCLIPGCGKPVHVDPRGMKSSDFCSLRHRQEAVTSGLVPACIKCLRFPQSQTDFFCSTVCREEASNKQSVYPDEEEYTP